MKAALDEMAIFDELIRRFNEDNNEEAGEHFTPRDAEQLMAKLVLLPVADKVDDGTFGYGVYPHRQSFRCCPPRSER